MRSARQNDYGKLTTLYEDITTELSPSEDSVDSILKMSAEDFFDLAEKWHQQGRARTGVGPQRRAEIAAQANPDQAAWQKAYEKATADYNTLRKEIAACDYETRMLRQKELWGAMLKGQYFTEGLKKLKQNPLE